MPFKRRADVLLLGHAYAPPGRSVRSLRARIQVGEVDKTIEVFGARAMSLDGLLHEGPPFSKMPLYWEYAAGGPETDNPVGMRADVADAQGATPLPHLQPPGLHVTRRGDYVPPVGFGPIAPQWPPRQARLHAALAHWDYRRWGHGALPPQLDPGFFNAAPLDQQLDALRADERIVLEHLLPGHARLVTNLVPVEPRGRVEIPGRATEELALRCDTLSVDTDRGTCTLTWRALLVVDPALAGRVIVTGAPARRSEASLPGLPFVPAPPAAEPPTLDGIASDTIPLAPPRSPPPPRPRRPPSSPSRA